MSALDPRSGSAVVVVAPQCLARATEAGRVREWAIRFAAIVLVVVFVASLGDELILRFLPPAAPPDVGFSCVQPAQTCTIASVRPDSTADSAGLRPGDVVVSVDGVPWSDSQSVNERLGHFAPGELIRPLRLLVGRADTGPREVRLVVQRAPLQTALRAPGASEVLEWAALAAVVLSVGAGVALARPAAPGARAVLVCSAALAYTVILLPELATPLRFQFGIPIAGWDTLTAAVAPCAVLDLSLVFPVRHSFLVRLDALVPRFLRPAIGGSVVLYLSTLVPVVVGQFIPWQAFGFDPFYAVTTGLWSAVLSPAVLVFIQSFRHPATPLARAQLKWLLPPMLLVLAGLATWTALGLVTGREPPETIWTVLAFGVLALFLAVVLAVLRYGLFDVDRVLRLSVTWILAVAMLLAGFLVFAFLGSRVAIAIAGRAAADDPTASVVAALVVAVAAYPLYHRLLRAVDQLIFRERIGRQRMLEESAVVLGRAQPPEVVGMFLTRQAPERLGVTCAWVALAPSMRAVAESAADEAAGLFTVAPPALVARMASLDFPLLLAPATDQDAYAGIANVTAEDPAFASWYAAGARALVPLRTDSPARQGTPRDRDGAGVVGVWIVGGRRSGDVLGRDDLLAFERVAALAAVLLSAQAEVRERERIAQELRIARLIQQTMLPSNVPCPPGWRLAAHYEAAREVGGDFYDILPLPDSRLGVVIGDVSGKGLPAALVMASTQSLLRSLAGTGAAPHRVLADANRLLRARVPERIFVTCQYLVVESATGVVRYASAGHWPPLLRRAGQAVELAACGLPLGILAEAEYAVEEVQLEGGDDLVLYSDGVVEARNSAGELFGFARLADLVANGHEGPELLARIRDELVAFRGSGEAAQDDVTLLVLGRGGSAASG